MEYQAGKATMLPLPGPKSCATILVLMTDSRDSWLWPLAAWWKKPRPRALSLLYLIAPLALQVIPTPEPKKPGPAQPPAWSSPTERDP